MTNIKAVKHPETTAEKTMWTNAWIYANEPILRQITGRHPCQNISYSLAARAVEGISQSYFDQVASTARDLFSYDFDQELQDMVRDRLVAEIGYTTLWPEDFFSNPDNCVRMITHAMFFYRERE